MPVILEDRNIILELFKKAFEGFEDFVFVDGINPCSIVFSGVKYNVYIKNLTPAQLSNKNDNIWRIQLPKRKAFEKIKNDSALFLLLGYDKDADVFASWNPYWAKQRLNVGESVSLYSRLNLQQEACLEEKFIEAELNHNSKVVLFPRTFLPVYIKKINQFFPNETEYVAIGSSLRKNKTPYLSTKNKAQELSLFSTDKDNTIENHQITESSKELNKDKKTQNTNVIDSNLSGVEIKDVSLIDNIISLLKQDPPQTLKCMEALASYLGDNFESLMSLKQWQQYVVNTDWFALKRKAEQQSTAINTDDELIKSILRNYGTTISAPKSKKYLQKKHLRILSDSKRPSLRIICNSSDRPEFYVKEDSPLIKFHQRGGILLPTHKTGLYSMIYKDNDRLYIIKLKNDGNPYEEGTLLF